MLRSAVELTMNLAVTHDLFLDFYSSRRFVGHVSQVGFLRSPAEARQSSPRFSLVFDQ
jgi:hypothetical protein